MDGAVKRAQHDQHEKYIAKYSEIYRANFMLKEITHDEPDAFKNHESTGPNVKSGKVTMRS